MKTTLISSLVLSTLLFAACSTALDAPQEMEEMEEMGTSTSVEVEVIEDTEAMEVQEEAAVSRLVAYDAAAYQDALAEGKTVFLDFHADWCATCVSNAPKIESAFEQLEDENVMGFTVNFDTEDELKKELGITGQSILVVLPGGDVSAARQNAGGLVTADEVLEFIRG